MDGKILSDHTWINYTSSFDAVGEFQQGDLVTFDASVGKYIKGYFGERIEDRMNHPAREDYRLKYPHNVKKIGTWDVKTSLMVHSSKSICVAGATGRL